MDVAVMVLVVVSVSVGSSVGLAVVEWVVVVHVFFSRFRSCTFSRILRNL